MTAKRLGAVIVAVALIAGGFAIRNVRDDAVSPDPSVPARPTDEPTDERTGDDDRAVICVPELDVVCDAIATAEPTRPVRTEEAMTTVGGLADADAGTGAVPIWITVDPYPGMVDAQRAAAGDRALGLATTPVGSTPLVVVATPERLDVLTAACGDVDIWACLGDHAGERWDTLGGPASWGTLRPSLGDVTDSVTALASLRAAASGYFGTTDFSRSSWETDTGFLGWLRPLVRTVDAADLSATTPLATMITRPSALDVAATTDAELAAMGSRGASLATHYPGTAMSLDAVIAAPQGAGGIDELVELASDALTEAGWGSATDPIGPSAATTVALIELWETTT
ncbi:MAG: hypothetical protein ACK5OX_04780 [Desertimonas sp.]